MLNKNGLLYGIIVLDKPSNYDSHQITACIKRILNVEKIGHGGTLDPKVTGVLPIFLNKATKLAHYFFKTHKEYVGIMQIHEDIDLKNIKETVKKFTGKIKQLPPLKSAVKRQEREREIYEFKILEKEGKNILFKVKCESGTYIRKLIHDFGIALGTGAHMLELRRTKDWFFGEDICVTANDIVNAINNKSIEKIIVPVEVIAKNMPKIIVKDEYLDRLYHGSPVYKDYVLSMDKFKKDDFVSVIARDKGLIEIARAILEGNVIAKPNTVLKNGI